MDGGDAQTVFVRDDDEDIDEVLDELYNAENSIAESAAIKLQVRHHRAFEQEHKVAVYT